MYENANRIPDALRIAKKFCFTCDRFKFCLTVNKHVCNFMLLI